jgi:two-component system, OmpR family, sensor kinase
MSLRLRLTLLYTTMLGGVILIFGSLVYALVSFILLDQIDSNLTRASEDLISRIRVNAADSIDPRSISEFQPNENVLIQIWGNNMALLMSRPSSATTVLDEVGRNSAEPVFRSVAWHDDVRTRVLSIPLTSTRGPVAVLQVGMSLSLIDVALSSLATVLVFLAVAFMILSWLLAWLVTSRALAPLETMTRVATNIIHADDLQRRIPLSGSAQDEVGILIQAFNQTLERLEKLFNSQRRFLADVSHELRTPLTVIKGNAGLLRRFGQADEESLYSIENEVDRLTRLVGDLLLLAQAESGRLPMMMDPVDLDTIFIEVYQQMRTLAGEKLQLRLGDIDQLQVTGDRDRLKQVFLNLVGNAIQYTPAGGQVTMSLRRLGEQAQIIVSDSGPGIPAEDLPHIFERFYRGEKSRKRTPTSGFGLGLSIAYWIVRSHGGTIDVHSQEGKGTIFSILLPISKTDDSSAVSTD